MFFLSPINGMPYIISICKWWPSHHINTVLYALMCKPFLAENGTSMFFCGETCEYSRVARPRTLFQTTHVPFARLRPISSLGERALIFHQSPLSLTTCTRKPSKPAAIGNCTTKPSKPWSCLISVFSRWSGYKNKKPIGVVVGDAAALNLWSWKPSSSMHRRTLSSMQREQGVYGGSENTSVTLQPRLALDT